MILTGLALNGRIARFSRFDRKNYFYPDLPKGYQISQYEHPLVQGGRFNLSGGKPIKIRRIHLEEDTGRLIHEKNTDISLVDFNRAGIPLMELVTEPDFRTGEEIKEFGEELQKILRYLGASHADMQKGEMRVEVNISIRPKGVEELGTKVEVKNINSFKFAADAADYETKRQEKILRDGKRVMQETRGWNETKNETFAQRSKEEAHDYRYFPEPDLPPLRQSPEFIETLKTQIPELPRAKKTRFEKEYGLEENMAELITRDRAFADYFESAASELKAHDRLTPEKPKKDLSKTLASLMTGDFLRLLKETGGAPTDTRITPENFAELALYIAEDKVSGIAAKAVLEEMFHTGGDPSDIIDKKNLWQMSGDSDLENVARRIISGNPKATDDFKNGKEASLQFLVGQIMKETRGRANPNMLQDLLRRLLS